MTLSDKKRLVLFLLPSVRISGGVWEVFRLASDLRSNGVDARIVSMWRDSRSVHDLDFPYHDVPISYLSGLKPRKKLALLQIPFLMWRFRQYSRELLRNWPNGKSFVVLTHYSTFPFASIIPKSERFCFVQDLEWRFVRGASFRNLLQRFLQSVLSQSSVITTNAWVTGQMKVLGITPVAEATIWPPAEFLAESTRIRSIDVLMLVRRNYFKRLDLYTEVCRRLQQESSLHLAVVTPDDATELALKSLVHECFVRPDRQELISIYQRSRIFLLLSEAEGFGLPPLEAMGSGCVPLCRDSGGVQCYMVRALKQNLIPLSSSADAIMERIESLLADPYLLDNLSNEGKEIFADGLQSTVISRAAAINALSEAFTDGG